RGAAQDLDDLKETLGPTHESAPCSLAAWWQQAAATESAFSLACAVRCRLAFRAKSCFTSPMERGLNATREANFADWYQAVVREAGLAVTSPVRGSMIIKPWGYGVWELIQQELDRRIKASGHQNAYFPLFVPLSFFAKEASHVEGFAKEMAVV